MYTTHVPHFLGKFFFKKNVAYSLTAMTSLTVRESLIKRHMLHRISFFVVTYLCSFSVGESPTIFLVSLYVFLSDMFKKGEYNLGSFFVHLSGKMRSYTTKAFSCTWVVRSTSGFSIMLS